MLDVEALKYSNKKEFDISIHSNSITYKSMKPLHMEQCHLAICNSIVVSLLLLSSKTKFQVLFSLTKDSQRTGRGGMIISLSEYKIRNLHDGFFLLKSNVKQTKIFGTFDI